MLYESRSIFGAISTVTEHKDDILNRFWKLGSQTVPRIYKSAKQSSYPPTMKIPRLRDSCDACASAKVRCTKSKPTCTRCEKREICCQYTATKRAGRRSLGSIILGPSVRTDQKAFNHEQSYMSNGMANATLPLPSCETSSPQSPSQMVFELYPSQHHAFTYPESFSTLPFAEVPGSIYSSPSTPSLSTSSSLTALGVDLDDFVSSLGPIAGPETPMGAQDLLTQSNFFNTPSPFTECSYTSPLPHDSFFPQDGTHVAMQSVTATPAPTKSGLSSIASAEYSTESSPPDIDGCSCRTIIHGFLEGIFPGGLAVWVAGAVDDSDDATEESLFPTLRRVIAENERMVEAIDNILQCRQCSGNGYVLVLLSLVIFKLLDRYATAAAVHFDSNRISCPKSILPCRVEVSARDLNPDESARVVAKMVLSELHHVQRLLKKLSARLKMHYAKSKVGGTSIGDFISTFDVLCGGESSSFFSTAVLEQIEADIQSHLRKVSCRLVDMLLNGLSTHNG